jgi:hypothetical protein
MTASEPEAAIRFLWLLVVGMAALSESGRSLQLTSDGKIRLKADYRQL